MPDSLADFTKTTFTHDGKTRDVYRLGEGPAVIVMAEVPGITPKVADFARRVAGDRLHGRAAPPLRRPGAEATVREYAIRSIAPGLRVQGVRRLRAPTAPRRSPVWLRALAADAHETCGGPGVGALGMCFTGGFALGMMLDDILVAPVLSQPSLPIGFSHKTRAGLQLSAGDLNRVKERAADGVCVLGLRFTGDPVVRAERFERLRTELGDNFIGVEIDSSKGNEWGYPTSAHSVLTEHYVDDPGQPDPRRARPGARLLPPAAARPTA